MTDAMSEFAREVIENVSKKLKNCRAARGVSYAELSEMTGISKSSLQRYETGATRKVSISAIRSIECALNLPYGYLLGWTDDSGKLKNFCFDDTPEPKNPSPKRVLDPAESYFSVFDTLESNEKDADSFVFAADNTMEKSRIKCGDAVYLNSELQAENGEIGAIKLGDKTHICHIKKEESGYKFYSSDAEFLLFSSDLEKDNITYLGKAVAILSIL